MHAHTKKIYLRSSSTKFCIFCDHKKGEHVNVSFPKIVLMFLCMPNLGIKYMIFLRLLIFQFSMSTRVLE